MTSEEKIKVVDNKGFTYWVTVVHKPHFGFSSAMYDGSIITQAELGRILSPRSDDDREWEMYEDRFGEWRDEILATIIPLCQNYFNN